MKIVTVTKKSSNKDWVLIAVWMFIKSIFFITDFYNV
jgi:hypothetical protein